MRRVAESDAESSDESARAYPAPENHAKDASRPGWRITTAARIGDSAGKSVGDEGQGSGAETLTEGPVCVFARWRR